MGNKEKGSKAERELYDMFVENSFRAVRVAGSGMAENTACDLIAGKVGKKYCIEVKSSKKPCKYISKKQIEEFIIFAEIFGLEPIIALRFNREGWFFIKPKNLEASKSKDFDSAQKSGIFDNSGKNWVISLEKARKKGKRFGQAFS